MKHNKKYTSTHTLFDTILPTKDHRTTPHPSILFPTPTQYHHKQPHNKAKTPQTPVQRPHDATDEVQHQHETAVFEKFL